VRDYGLRRTIKKVVRTYLFARQRLYVTYVDWVVDAKRPLDLGGYEVRRARASDSLAAAFPHLTPSDIATWFRPDHFFYVLLRGEDLVGYRCESTRPSPSVSRFLRLRPDQTFSIDHFIRPDLRRLGLARSLKFAVARDLAARGYTGSFGTEVPTNYATLISAPRRGTLRVGTLSRTCLLGRVRFALTPVKNLSPELVHRQLVMLKRVAPHVSHVGVLFNPSVVMTAADFEQATKTSAAGLGVTLTFLPVREASDQAAALAGALLPTAHDGTIDGLIVFSDPMLKEYRRTIVALVNRLNIPAVYDATEFVAAGGLMSYDAAAPCLRDFDSVMAYVTAVKAEGHPPPHVEHPHLGVNSKAAAALGLAVPSSN
jgi:hypothetical protein